MIKICWCTEAFGKDSEIHLKFARLEVHVSKSDRDRSNIVHAAVMRTDADRRRRDGSGTRNELGRLGSREQPIYTSLSEEGRREEGHHKTILALHGEFGLD